MAGARYIKTNAKCPKRHRCKMVGRGSRRRKMAIPKKRKSSGRKRYRR